MVRSLTLLLSMRQTLTAVSPARAEPGGDHRLVWNAILNWQGILNGEHNYTRVSRGEICK